MVIKSTLLLLLITLTLKAQKLPNKQEVSLRAPFDTKIDGIASEWGQFQAYNKATEVFYTVANDDDNLYLAIRVVKPYIISKVISGSITLTVNSTGKKNDEKTPTITFPLLNSKYGAIIRSNLKDETQAIDSLLLATNNALTDNAKEIKISGINAITDTLTGTTTNRWAYFRTFPLFDVPGYYITTYNNYGIKTASRFESKWTYIYELAIPLKYLNIKTDEKFSYNIRLNGAMYKTARPTAGFTVVRVYNNGVGQTLNEDLLSPTDVWGEYTLAK